MAETAQHREVTIERLHTGRYVARNGRGGELEFATGDVPDFTPVELLLVAIGGCTGVDVDFVTSRRAEPEEFVISVGAEKVKNDAGSILEDIVLTVRARFPQGEAGDQARKVLPEILKRSHDRLCTVSRTVEHGRTVTVRTES
ncbi:MAG TPA: OsmC family protein [Dermatophilaceae bacterium]|nr:OsmC family protein [Dermatophilaceae bacterium]